MIRVPALTLCIAALVICLGGCEQPNDDGGQSEDREIVRRGNGGEPGSLDPALAEDIHAFSVLVDLYEGLVAEGADGELIPGVAKSWTVSDDGLVYRFNLRSDARWSNGQPVLATDFVTAFRRVASPDTQSGYAFLHAAIENFTAVGSGQESVENLGIHATSDRVLEFTLSTPSSEWLAVLTQPVSYPVAWNEAGDMLSNGAFELVSREIGGPIRLQTNEHYWDSASIEIDEVIYFPIENALTEFNMYRSNELDVTHTIPTELYTQARADFVGEVRVAPALALYYLAFDLTEPPFDRPLLRKALTMAIDRQQLIALTGRGEQPAYGIVPPGVAGYENVSYEWRSSTGQERKQAARDAYLEAGYSAENPLKIRFIYDVGSIHEEVAVTVATMWKEVLGINVEIEKREWMYFLDTRDRRQDWDIMRFAWFGDYNGAGTFLDIFLSTSEQNLPKLSSADYDKMLSAANATRNVEKRLELLQAAEKRLIDEYPIAPLYFFVSKHMVKQHIKGFKDNVTDRHPSRFLKVEPL